MKGKNIIAVFALLLFPGLGYAENATNAAPEPFAWVVNSNYTDNVFKTVSSFIELRDILHNPEYKGKVVKVRGNCPEYIRPRQLLGKVYATSLCGCRGVTSWENYSDICSLKDRKRGPVFYYIFIPDDDLQKQILNDIKALRADTTLKEPFLIMLGVRAKIGLLGKTTYSW